MEPEIKIRPLKRKDRKTLTAMIKKFAEKVGANQLFNLITSDPTTPKAAETKNADDVFTRVGIELVKQMIEVLDDDMAIWFADLIGKTKEEFDDMPFSVEAIIIEQLTEAKEIEDFFIHASHAFSRMRGFAGQAKTETAK